MWRRRSGDDLVGPGAESGARAILTVAPLMATLPVKAVSTPESVSTRVRRYSAGDAADRHARVPEMIALRVAVVPALTKTRLPHPPGPGCQCLRR